MKEILKKVRENKVLKIIGSILYFLLFVIVILMLIIVIMQRVTDNSISLGGYRMFTVATGSMEPEYNIGDVLISKEQEAKNLKVGDDVVYRGKEGSFNGRIVTHRIISINQENNQYKIITKGIANTEQDPEIADNQVIGKIVYKSKILSFLGGLINNVYIFYFIIFVPIGIIIFVQIRNILRKDEEEEDE